MQVCVKKYFLNSVFFLLCTAALIYPPFVNAEHAGHANTYAGSGVKIRISSLYDQLPNFAFLPVLVNIKNNSGKTREWQLTTSSNTRYSASEIDFVEKFEVKNGEHRIFTSYVPTTPILSHHYYKNFSVQLFGYGVQNAGLSMNLNVRPYVSGSKSLTLSPFMLYSSGLMPADWTEIKGELEKRSYKLYGSFVAQTKFPSDWRGLLGVDIIWLFESDWKKLTNVQKDAIKDWVTSGGTLYFGSAYYPFNLKKFSVRDSSKSLKRVGLGKVHFEYIGTDYKSAKKGIIEILSKTGPLKTTLPSLDQYINYWGLKENVEDVEVPAGILSFIMICYAMLVGPINVFVFARRGKRYRLFLTTPVIAATASLLLAITIIFKDGIGGDGKRTTLVMLQPNSSRAVVLQEQISRTGALIEANFSQENDLYMMMLPITSKYNQDFTQRKLGQEQSNFSGDWFASRAVQGHYLQTIIPTRARIEIINATTERPAELHSSIDAPLKELFYVDKYGEYWRASDIKVGSKFNLKLSSYAHFYAALGPHLRTMGPMLKRLEKAVEDQAEYYIGLHEGETNFTLNTLDSINWEKSTTIFFGSLPGGPV